MKTIYKKPEYRTQLAELTAKTQLQLPGESHSHTIDLTSMSLLAISQGGISAQRFMALHPDKVEKAILYVPAGLVGPPPWSAFKKFIWPMQMLKLTGKAKYLNSLIENIFTTKPDADTIRFFELGLTGLRLDLRTLKLKQGEMKALGAKTLIVGAQDDIIFPGETLLARAKEVYGPEIHTILLKGAKHSLSPGDKALEDLLEQIADFLQARP